MKDPLLRNLSSILLGVVIQFQLLILIQLVSTKLSIGYQDTPCGKADYDPCKVTIVPYR
jgi:hypothetical protein